MAASVLETFLTNLPFKPDTFQVEALKSVEKGRAVVVTAPTGSGKTVVADGAITLTLHRGERSFYTTPIKALSNQKFSDLIAEHGADHVGLLTGDNVINGDAPIVVMTTEVLRNMIYEESEALENLGLVVLDEVHYLADRNRGSVWEEIIVHLPKRITLVCLSATIANPEEFTDWIRERRGICDLVIETERPIPLTSMYMWRDKHRDHQLSAAPVFGPNGRPNSAVSNMFTSTRGRHRRFSTPRRVSVVRELDREGLLPCIYFVFSRKGCDQTAHEIAHAGLDFTTSAERSEIRIVAERHVEHLSPEDLAVLGYQRWLGVLEKGAASHHAGLIPAFKETVEELFLAGLTRAVAATETLALGINMPARTVVIDSLSKFNGETHELLLPSDYTQLTGRAGRRGIDVEGTAVVLFSSYVPFDRVAAIAAKGANPLRSSFSPTYNMAVNLISRYDFTVAHELLAASFANFSQDHKRERLRENLADREGDLATFRSAAECSRGSIWEIENHTETPTRSPLVDDLLQPGAVIEIGGERLVLLTRSWGGGQPKLLLTDANGKRRMIRTRDLPSSAHVLGDIVLLTPHRSQDLTYRRSIGEILAVFEPQGDPSALFPGVGSGDVAGCPDLETHLKWAARARRAERDVRRLNKRLSRSETNNIGLEFDKRVKVLDATGYTDGWNLTVRGESLRRLYSELDLLLAEVLRSGIFSGLAPAEFGAMASIFTYQARGGEISNPPESAFSSRPIDGVGALAESISKREMAAGLVATRAPDVGLVDSIHAWGSGLGLGDIFDEDDMRAGDFVRSCRQLLDLLRQIRDGFPEYRSVAAKSITLIDRGIVAAGVLR